MSEDTDEVETVETWGPRNPAPPAREPPLRSTAPQSEFNTAQVGFGLLVFLVGVALTFGLPLLLA